LTLRKLVAMCTAKRRHDWQQTARICSTLYGAQGHKVTEDRFIPPDLLQGVAGPPGGGTRITKDNIDSFSQFFCGDPKPAPPSKLVQELRAELENSNG
jgi:hypothetical protein|tara:strand:- start:221 stop:514 length:294 start_codon:yes stop_codon:yes gene_type:complete